MQSSRLGCSRAPTTFRNPPSPTASFVVNSRGSSFPRTHPLLPHGRLQADRHGSKLNGGRGRGKWEMEGQDMGLGAKRYRQGQRAAKDVGDGQGWPSPRGRGWHGRPSTQGRILETKGSSYTRSACSSTVLPHRWLVSGGAHQKQLPLTAQ